MGPLACRRKRFETYLLSCQRSCWLSRRTWTGELAWSPGFCCGYTGAFTVHKALASWKRGEDKDAHDLFLIWSGFAVHVVAESLASLLPKKSSKMHGPF